MSPSEGITLSAARRLPWEQEQTKEVRELQEGIEVEADQLST
jgi:hypothetical protein